MGDQIHVKSYSLVRLVYTFLEQRPLEFTCIRQFKYCFEWNWLANTQIDWSFSCYITGESPPNKSMKPLGRTQSLEWVHLTFFDHYLHFKHRHNIPKRKLPDLWLVSTRSLIVIGIPEYFIGRNRVIFPNFSEFCHFSLKKVFETFRISFGDR